MKPDVASQPLLYVTDSGSGTVKTYLYPSLTYVGQITGFTEPLFLCLGKSNSVFVVDYATGNVSEYAHATASPIQVLTGLTLPYQCAYDKQTKDLAVVANIENPSEHIGYVAVYHHATGTPHLYYDRNASILTVSHTTRKANLRRRILEHQRYVLLRQARRPGEHVRRRSRCKAERPARQGRCTSMRSITTSISATSQRKSIRYRQRHQTR